jgi:hypothetical protein
MKIEISRRSMCSSTLRFLGIDPPMATPRRYDSGAKADGAVVGFPEIN